MFSQTKILLLALCLIFASKKVQASPSNNNAVFFPRVQIDSLIKEKSDSIDMGQLDLLVLYLDALNEKHPDSITIFKNVAILNAELEQPGDAYIFTKKYIENTLDFSVLNNGAYESIENTNEYCKLKATYLPNVNPFAFIYFYTALIGFFLAIIICLKKKANNFSKIFIASFIVIHSLFILAFVLNVSNFRYQVPHVFLMASSMALLYGPLFYFYYKSVIQKYTFKYIDLLHLLPTILLLIILFPFYASQASDKIRMMIGVDDSHEGYITLLFILKAISLIIYGFFLLTIQFKRVKEIYEKNKNKSIFRWMKTLYLMHIAYIISYLIYAVSSFGMLGQFSHYIVHAQVGIMSLMVVYIAYMSYVQPNVFNNEYVSTPRGIFFVKYKKSGLTEALSNELKESLVKLLLENKIYKNNNICLEILANKLNTTRHNASQIINEHFQMNFFELINKFRIKEAINMMQEDVHGNLNIIDIAYEVGYNNKVTFNKAFKKETSLTPSDFINSKGIMKSK